MYLENAEGKKLLKIDSESLACLRAWNARVSKTYEQWLSEGFKISPSKISQEESQKLDEDLLEEEKVLLSPSEFPETFRRFLIENGFYISNDG